MVKWNGIPFLEISSLPLPWVPQPHEPLKSLYLSFVPSPFSVTCCLTHTLCPFLEEAPREDPVASARPQRPELRLSPRPRDPGARPRDPPPPQPEPHLPLPAGLLCVQRAVSGNRAHLPAAAGVEMPAPAQRWSQSPRMQDADKKTRSPSPLSETAAKKKPGGLSKHIHQLPCRDLIWI